VAVTSGRATRPIEEMARRLFVPCLMSAALLAAAFACDPDLTPVKHDADGGGDAGPGPGPGPSPTDSGTSSNDGSSSGDDSSTGDDGSTGTSHKIDGIDDFNPNEKFLTSSAGYEGFIAWDDKRLYFGMSGNDIGSNATNKWVFVYLGLDGTPGTTTGIKYGMTPGQQPTLPFAASYHLRWKASNDFTTVEKWNDGTAKWEAAGVANVPIVSARQNKFMEMSITRASIGATGKLKVHMNMIVEDPPPPDQQWTFAAVPSTSLTDGPDRDYTKYFEFDLADTTKAPGSYTPK
jgi:hypothetical protein